MDLEEQSKRCQHSLAKLLRFYKSEFSAQLRFA